MQSDRELIPVEGRDTVEILSHDHEVIKGLLDQLTDTTQKTERRSVIERLKAALTIHNATEENIVYPAIDKIAHHRAESEHLYHETAEADVVFFELEGLLKEADAPDFAAKASRFRDVVRHHLDNEETSAFPHLQQEVDPPQAKMLTDSVRAFRNSLHYDIAKE